MRQCEGTPGAWEGREEQGQVGLLVGGFSGGGHAPGRNHMLSISIWHPPDYLLHFSGNSHPESSRHFGSYCYWYYDNV